MKEKEWENVSHRIRAHTLSECGSGFCVHSKSSEKKKKKKKKKKNIVNATVKPAKCIGNSEECLYQTCEPIAYLR